MDGSKYCSVFTGANGTDVKTEAQKASRDSQGRAQRLYDPRPSMARSYTRLARAELLVRQGCALEQAEAKSAIA